MQSTNFSERWRSLDWKKIRRVVFRLQMRLFKAMRAGDKVRVRNLQNLILRSRSARLLAIRQVTQLNAGRKTAGIDGIESLDFQQRFELEEKLAKYTNSWKHSKLREIPIPDRKLGHNCSANALPPGALYSLTIGYSLTTNSYR